MIERPTRPWKNLQDAKRDLGNSFRTYKADEFPCLNCHGRGKYRDQRDSDPIEGYKLAPWYQCRTCDGTGMGSREQFMACYRERMADYRQAIQEYDQQKARFEILREKLSDEELDLLCDVFRHCLTSGSRLKLR